MIKKLGVFGIALCLMLTGCASQTEDSEETQTETETTTGTTEDSQHATTSTVALEQGEYSDEELDDTWSEENVTSITLTGETAEIEGSGATVEGGAVTISAAGSYVLSGELTDGRIIVNAASGDVRLILNGVTITSSENAAIEIQEADTVITLAEGSSNYIEDGSGDSQASDRCNAAIYAKDDLVFNGSGTLQVVGNYKNGIQSKDKLKLISGTYDITAANHGLVGKDCITIKDGDYTIVSEGDGMQATNIEETDKGYIIIDGGTFNITSAGDAIQAETLLRINDGEYELVSGGGSEAAVSNSNDEMMPGDGGMPNGGGRQGGGGQNGGEMPSGEAMSEMGEAPNGGEMPDQGERPEMGDAPGGSAGSQDGTESGTDGSDESESETDQSAAATDENLKVNSAAATNAVSDNVESVYKNTAANETATSDEDNAETTSDESGAANAETPSDENGAANEATTSDESGSTNEAATSEESTKSTKGLKSYVDLIVAGGTLTINACDDGIHSNDAVTIEGGIINISAGDDGIHADEELVINEGNITIDKSYEGLEGYTVTINGGTIDLTSEDDGINAAQKSTDSSSEGGGFGMEQSQGAVMTINGGDIQVDASGDGLDANGQILMNGGNLIVYGPVTGGNGTFDYDDEFIITGGTVIGVGTAEMAQSASEDSTQGVITGTFATTIAANTEITVSDASGNEILSATTKKESSWFMISAAEIEKSETYTIQAGDESVEVTAQ